MSGKIKPFEVITPDKTIGILGGGQLGMMSAQAAMRMGYQVLIYAPPGDTPATRLPGIQSISATYDNDQELVNFAHRCDVVTLEFENVPVTALDTIGKYTRVHPGPNVLLATQDRLIEKKMVIEQGLRTTKFTSITKENDLAGEATSEEYYPGILKTACLGYDGHGQERVRSRHDLEKAWRKLGQKPTILEKQVDLRCELSVIVARNESGEMVHLGPFDNTHEDGILRKTIFPAALVDALIRNQAIEDALHLAEKLEVVGLLTVEMFVTRQGKLLINELAPRPHNSGHMTIEAFDQSQFDLHIKAICGHPLIAPQPLCRRAQMRNILGEEIYQLPDSGHIHIYGKKEASGRRKMGHVTILD